MPKISLAVRNDSVTLPVSLVSVSRITFQFSARCFFSLLSLELCVRSLDTRGFKCPGLGVVNDMSARAHDISFKAAAGAFQG